ncbi:MAG: hypothetical protein LBQ81_07260 [Zoogloeaceae bacterium]|jgi:hypothetical protein|nr:hypothetical protein [Zoogloeaceae bacterium]
MLYDAFDPLLVQLAETTGIPAYAWNTIQSEKDATQKAPCILVSPGKAKRQQTQGSAHAFTPKTLWTETWQIVVLVKGAWREGRALGFATEASPYVEATICALAGFKTDPDAQPFYIGDAITPRLFANMAAFELSASRNVIVKKPVP